MLHIFGSDSCSSSGITAKSDGNFAPMMLKTSPQRNIVESDAEGSTRVGGSNEGKHELPFVCQVHFH